MKIQEETSNAEVQTLRELILKVKSTLLEGNYDRRRMAYFSGMDDVRGKRFAFEKVIKDLIKLQRRKRIPDEQANLKK